MFRTSSNNKYSKKWWSHSLLIFAAAVTLVGVFDFARPVAAGFVSESVSEILDVVASFFGKALLVVIEYVITFSGFNNFIDAPVVQTGWVLTRDIANMFYVFVFLLIAFGTMLKSEQYNWKKLLPRLLITALMVNFSRLIIGLLIDFSQVVMLTFVNGFAAVGGGNFLQALQIEKMFKLAVGEVDPKNPPNLSKQNILAHLLAAVLLGVALVVTAVFAAILLARIIALWILIVLSPMAFLLGTFPKGKTYYDDWWKKLGNQIIVGPVLAFFLWLALATVGDGRAFDTISTGSATYRAAQLDNIKVGTAFPSVADTEAGTYTALGSYLVSIGILFAGLMVTQQLGVAGSGLAGGAAGWMKGVATKAVKRGALLGGLAMYAGPGGALALLGAAKVGKWGAKTVAGAAWSRVKREANERLPTWANVPAKFKAWQERTKKEGEESKQFAADKQLQAYWKRRGVDLPIVASGELHRSNDLMKVFSDMSQEEQVVAAKQLTEAPDSKEVDRQRILLARIMQRSGFVDDFAVEAQEDLSPENRKAQRGRTAQREILENLLFGKGFSSKSEEEQDKILEKKETAASVLSGRIGFENGHFELGYGMALDPKTRKYKRLSDSEQESRMVGEINKGGPEMMKNAAPHVAHDLDAEGNVVDVKEEPARALYSNRTPDAFNRNRPPRRVANGVAWGNISGQVTKDQRKGFTNDEAGIAAEKVYKSNLQKYFKVGAGLAVEKDFDDAGVKGIVDSNGNGYDRGAFKTFADFLQAYLKGEPSQTKEQRVTDLDETLQITKLEEKKQAAGGVSQELTIKEKTETKRAAEQQVGEEDRQRAIAKRGAIEPEEAAARPEREAEHGVRQALGGAEAAVDLADVNSAALNDLAIKLADIVGQAVKAGGGEDGLKGLLDSYRGDLNKIAEAITKESKKTGTGNKVIAQIEGMATLQNSLGLLARRLWQKAQERSGKEGEKK